MSLLEGMDLTSTLSPEAYGGALAGLGAAGASNPYTLPLTLALALLPALFGKKEPDPIENMIKYLGPAPQQYRSPYLRQMDPAVLRAVLAQMARTSNWGWPAGLQGDIGLSSLFKNVAPKALPQVKGVSNGLP